MDDTVAMQDTIDRSADAPGKGEAMKLAAFAAGGGSSAEPLPLAQSPGQQPQPQQLLQPMALLMQLPQQPALEQPVCAGGVQLLAPPPVLPLSGLQAGLPLQLQQQPQACDASSTNSDGSQDAGGARTHMLPRRNHSSVDVDAAKQAAMSALAGLDMTTTKANLDASKAAAATARANGEIPTHARKSALRSVSCRQLGSSATSSSAAASVPAKSVGFDDSASGGLPKARTAADGTRPTVQWRAGTATADGQPRRTTRAPASRCISLPHVLSGRQGMANRLAASYAQDAALQQQLHLLNGSTPGAQYPGLGLQPQVDGLGVYQVPGAGGPTLLSQRSMGATPVISLDDSMLHLQSGNILLPQQQQPAAQLAPGWAPGGPQQHAQRVTWAPGTVQMPQPAVAAPGAHNAPLLVQAAPPAPGTSGDALWLPAPASAGLQMPGSRPQALVVAASAQGGIPGMATSGGLLSAPLQQGGGTPPGLAPGAGGAVAATPSSAAFSALLEQYSQVSWGVLAAAQGEAGLRDQLLTELVLQLTMLHTLSAVLKSSLSPSDALNDFNYLGSAARRHMATFSRLSQAGNLAVQLLALITPLACRHLGSAELLDAAFLVLDALALANSDVAAVVNQQRASAMALLFVQLPMEQLLQQQTQGLAWLNNMSNAVSHNKQLLERVSVASADVGAAGPAVSAALLQQQPGMGGVMPLGGLPASQPMLVAPAVPGAAPALSPTRKTPLATYFEDGPGLGVPQGAAGGAALVGLPGAPGHPVAASPSALSPGDAMLSEGLASMHLGAGSAAPDDAAALPGLPAGLGAGAAPRPTAPGGALPGGPYSPLGGGMSLFGEPGLVMQPPASSSGPSSSGAPTGIVGV